MREMAVDLETLGKEVGCPIITIGWAVFDYNGLYHSGQIPIGIDEQLMLGCEINGGTFAWWLTQSNEARSALAAQMKKELPVRHALEEFSQIWSNLGCETVWGNGPTFDMSILEDLMKKAGHPPPWKYYNIRCVRTIAELAKINKKQYRRGLAHDAEADAVDQAGSSIAEHHRASGAVT